MVVARLWLVSRRIPHVLGRNAWCCTAQPSLPALVPTTSTRLTTPSAPQDLKTISAILQRHKKLPDTHRVCYIIAPSTGGANHQDNYCVLPKALALPAHTSAGAGYNLLMAKLLPKAKITKAVTAAQAKPAGTAYAGPSADKLAADADAAFKAEQAFPWGNSRSGGGAAAGGAAANGAQEDDSQVGLSCRAGGMLICVTAVRCFACCLARHGNHLSDHAMPLGPAAAVGGCWS